MHEKAQRSRPRSGSAGSIQSLTRALELLEALHECDYARVDELARLHGVHKTTTLRLLQTLERFGYVARGRDRGEFQLGLKLYRMGSIVGERLHLLRAARQPTR